MLLQIDKILSAPECEAIVSAVGDPALWRDGKETAKGGAKSVKSNTQAAASAPPVKGSVSKILDTLRAHPVFQAAAQPADFIRPTINRYSPGMSYGDHVDAPYINNLRTDLSFTLFLTDPDTYAGGELVIDNQGHEDRIKGSAGSLVLYPSSSVHRVDEVTTGERICCIGWVKSRIRSAEQRGLLFEIEQTLADLRDVNAPSQTHNRLLNVRNNLLRLFGE
ncbi:Fe2+-dependent dioxygenase [Hyphococcus flavus]|uniref:Fe2+-dependent dioxygenase n=1 Tax=Hyphococcus flavus TaxID=1866326 RepID=A0AAF0CEC4_9PROT|nr:Fe2+-dependent dioxygenase [Hyphococcus flavus]WDI31076.1 Fe2+-dependent dioxygenase [Hyphococcus flavus]